VPALRRLTVEETETVVVLGGTVSSYYLKQLAQETILPALRGRELHNRVTIGGKPASPARSSPADFNLVWDPEAVSAEEYAQMVAALGDIVRAAGGVGVKRIAEQGFGVSAGKVVTP
jgi:hypothetical protein